jgi:hypothetical protein
MIRQDVPALRMKSERLALFSWVQPGVRDQDMIRLKHRPTQVEIHAK